MLLAQKQAYSNYHCGDPIGLNGKRLNEVHLDLQEADKKLCSAKLWTENKEQNVFDSESRRSDLSFTVQKDTEVIHRKVKE